MKKILSVFLILVIIMSLMPTVMVSAKTTTRPYYIVRLSGKTIKNQQNYFDVKGGKKITVKTSDILANGSCLYDVHVVSNTVLKIIRNNSRFDYIIMNSKGKVVTGGSVSNNGTIEVPGAGWSKYRISIVTRYVNDGTNINVSGGKQYVASNNGNLAATYGCYWLEY